jgi:dihydrofolate synthase/folylpolyglutamate synthase
MHPRRIILDGAHNPAAWQTLLKSIKNTYRNSRLFLVIGIMRDKDMRSLGRLIAQAHACFFFRPALERSAGPEYLEKYIVFSRKKRVFWCETIGRALDAAQTESTPKDTICVTGSLFAVGEAREQLTGGSTTTSGRIAL